jgi:hypothetical protein
MQRQHDLVIRVAVSFDGSPIGLYFLHRRGRLRATGSQRTLWIGEAPDVTIPCAAPELPAARFPIVRKSRGGPGYTLLCPEAFLDGNLCLGGVPATRHSLAAMPCSDYPGVLEVELRFGMELTLTLGLVTLRVTAGQLPRRLALAPPFCVRPHVPTLFIALLAGAVAALASSVPPSPQPLWGEPALRPRVSLLHVPTGPAGASISFHRAAPSAGEVRWAGFARAAPSLSRGSKPKPPSRAVAPADALRPSFAELIGRQSILGEAAAVMAQIKDDGGDGGIGGLVGTGGGRGGDGSIALDRLSPGAKIYSASCHERTCYTPGGPEIAVGEAVVTCSNTRGCSDKELIRRIVRQHVNEVRYCYERALQRQPALQGRVGIRFRIAPDGRVQQSEAASSTVADPAVGRCIADAVRRFTFPATGRGITEVNYPFELQLP